VVKQELLPKSWNSDAPAILPQDSLLITFNSVRWESRSGKVEVFSLSEKPA